MPTNKVIQVLKEERRNLEKQLHAVNSAIKALGGWISSGGNGGWNSSGGKKRKMSAATRKKIAAAQKARWAKAKGVKS